MLARALRQRDALAAARFNQNLRALLCRSAGFGDEFGLASAERHEIRARSDGGGEICRNGPRIDLDGPGQFGGRLDRLEGAAGGRGGSDRQADPFGGRDETALSLVQCDWLGEPGS